MKILTVYNLRVTFLIRTISQAQKAIIGTGQKDHNYNTPLYGGIGVLVVMT